MGGYVRNIYMSNVTLAGVDVAIRFTGEFGEHPDKFYDPKALPLIEKVTIKDVTGENMKVAGFLEGIEGDIFVDICLSNRTLAVTSVSPWNCSYIQGYSNLVSPQICETRKRKIFAVHYSSCYHL
ncbi:hypothetical protein CFOL_v3_34403 [Cephalotus follicularis]|uniref:Glyco_hydro_28 domain-containing protein n=1 Tax=Cephalotus follicularis TaxID=3775 RepID=A0A1Q3DFB7_CEPFO|nr:hypothetical protein CFOL_v3_34403 [Cephalotus follicularis]